MIKNSICGILTTFIQPKQRDNFKSTKQQREFTSDGYIMNIIRYADQTVDSTLRKLTAGTLI